MAGCLGVGSSAAKTLAAALQKPLVGAHHTVRSSPSSSFHLFKHSVRSKASTALTPVFTSTPDSPRFPFLILLVSGWPHSFLQLLSPSSAS